MQAVVVAKGEIHQNEGLWREVAADALIVCADGGAANALDLGLVPQVVIGDMDSVGGHVRRELDANGTRFVVPSNAQG